MVRNKQYLTSVPLAEVMPGYFRFLKSHGVSLPLPAETVPLQEARGRVTAEPLFARLSVPHYHGAAMDGIAVRAEDTKEARETNPLTLLLGQTVQYVDTGDPLPDGCDAVIMIEEVHDQGDGTVKIYGAAHRWQHVRSIGEDVAAGELLFPENTRLGPAEIALALSAGICRAVVRSVPKVAVIPTGSEIVPPGGEIKPGDIIDSNSSLLAGMVEEWGGQARIFPIMRDDFSLLKETIAQAATQYDLIIINAGSSAGSEDFTAKVVAELGGVYVHGVAMRPGKPVVLGIANGTSVIGTPGYPVSAWLAMDQFVKPLLFAMQGLTPPARPCLKAKLARKLVSTPGQTEFVRLKIGRINDQFVAAPLSRGAGLLSSVARADGLLVIPPMVEELEEGASVSIELLKPLSQVEKTLLAVGSHDMALDILADLYHRLYPDGWLSSAHVGSTGGLLALRRGEAHLAGIHLLDPDTGEYNRPYLTRYLPDKDVALLRLAGREQGLMVHKGNPKGIKSIADLARPDVTFVNRQRGAGTRILLDLELKKAGISLEQVKGYEREVYTHLAAAAEVQAGGADAALGIYSAAKAMGLDFISLTLERYDLAIPREFLSLPEMQKLMECIQSVEFKKSIMSLGGYDVSETGQFV